ncbi:phage gp46-like protein [Duganella sp. SG902]|uniref:phage GP46 family protein n=1 Tax=Duganella sp. SG902 TaxID=2587016 RepID=UPI00159DBD62|nr:phage GP46 family protein [Duganella sp. SG902]NVM78911.1 phage gp46-like protein [Duganella sp. SG902]
MDIFVNPTTSDYQLVDGAPSRDPMAGLANAAYFRLMTPLGSYWADPTLGSRLHELERQKDLGRYSVLAKQYAQAALKPLMDDGRASSIDVSVAHEKDGTGGGRIYLGIVLTAVSGEQTTFRLPLKVI